MAHYFPYDVNLRLLTLIIHRIFSLARDWSKRVTWVNIPQPKLGNIREYSSIFKNCAHCVKDLKDNKDKSLHLGRKYARIFVLGHYLFLVAHSFPRATLSENCSPLGTDNVRGQISEHIFAPNGGYCLYSRSFLANQKARNAIVGAENLLNQGNLANPGKIMKKFKSNRTYVLGSSQGPVSRKPRKLFGPV